MSLKHILHLIFNGFEHAQDFKQIILTPKLFSEFFYFFNRPIRGTGYLWAYPLAVIEAIVYRTLSAMVFYINQRYYERLFSLFDSSSFVRTWAYTALTSYDFFQFSLGMKTKSIPITEVFARFATSYPLHNPSDDQFTLWIQMLLQTPLSTQEIGFRKSLKVLENWIDNLNQDTREEKCRLLFSLILENFYSYSISTSEQLPIVSLIKNNWDIFSNWVIQECQIGNDPKREKFLRFLAKLSTFNELIQGDENLEKFLTLISLFQGNLTENLKEILTNIARKLSSASQRKLAFPFLLQEFRWERVPKPIILQIRKWSKEEASSETYKIIIERVPHQHTTHTDPVQIKVSNLLRKEFSTQEKGRPQPETSAFVQPLIETEQARWQKLSNAQHLLEANFVLDLASGDPNAFPKFIETFPDGIPEFDSAKAISICRICINDGGTPHQRSLILLFLMCMKTTKSPQDTLQVKDFFNNIFLRHTKSKASDYAFLYRSLLENNGNRKNDILEMIALTIGMIRFQSREDWISFGKLIDNATGLKIPHSTKIQILEKLKKEIKATDPVLYPPPIIGFEPQHYALNVMASFLSAVVSGPNKEYLEYRNELINLQNKIENLRES